MASGFFALFDDIAVLMDDVAAMSKLATKKTAGILGDDLAVNAEKASGFVSSREMPVIWAITKGSFLNKLIILPLIFLLSAFLPQAIVVILILGGAFLAYEGAEKIFEFFFHKKEQHNEIDTKEYTEEEILEHEKSKIKSAIFTDFILSLEIVIIAFSSVMKEPLITQIMVVSVVAIIATVGVYGIVALLVRIDDLGLKLINLNDEEDSFSDKIGHFLVALLPKIIKGLSVLGTIALLLVAGGIFVHEIEFIHELLHTWPSLLAEFVTGLTVGFVVLFIVLAIKKVIGK